jgi:hypothetical protein
MHENTGLYRDIFGCDPDDTIKNVAELTALRTKVRARTPEEQLKVYEQLSPSIKGHMVDWPLSFMSEENLEPGWTQVEGMLPERNFL